MKKHSQIVLLVIFLLAVFLNLKCKKESCLTCPLPIQNTVQLTLNYTECKEVWLKLKFTDSNNPHSYALFRDGKNILAGTLTTTDTLLVDDSVVAGHEYTYTAQRLNGSAAVDISSSLQVRTLDSTSHIINWIVDTLGAQGVIRDVWVFDRNNAWAVGEIYLNDSTGKPDMANPYNAAQWNGGKWELKRIPFFGSCSAVLYPPLKAIWAFSSTNMLLTNGGSMVTYDGINATMDCRMNSLLTGAINKIYAVNSQNVYAVGNGGNIARYNGSDWTKMTSGTSVDLQDIYEIGRASCRERVY
jgi:hypothetical protein